MQGNGVCRGIRHPTQILAKRWAVKRAKGIQLALLRHLVPRRLYLSRVGLTILLNTVPTVTEDAPSQGLLAL